MNYETVKKTHLNKERFDHTTYSEQKRMLLLRTCYWLLLAGKKTTQAFPLYWENFKAITFKCKILPDLFSASALTVQNPTASTTWNNTEFCSSVCFWSSCEVPPLKMLLHSYQSWGQLCEMSLEWIGRVWAHTGFKPKLRFGRSKINRIYIYI